ncbi:hypothetical protein N7476_001249 [Penicillium atrosanguineum]|uniref:Spindle pole body component n=1 Tax=Penicillium atrosanguineum TaxID=1132637 RepID=A0A9W9QD34_9EURO|nr:hypothetical protein N7526_000574 [Penicillium atrosanguineum]KAJ5331466.1 hypothetical protein N7476_001249 [Penicillium atrosanguineum]
MDSDELDPFSSESLWRLSKFSLEALQPLETLPWNTELPDVSGSLIHQSTDTDSKIDPIWKLNLFNTDSEQLESASNSIIDHSIDARSDAPTEPLPELGEEDLWDLDLLQEKTSHIAPLKSWERYQDRSFQEPVSAYFSESGAKGFDAALARQSTEGRDISGRLVRDDIFIRSLLRLGLGWSSAFFRFNQKKMAFERYMKDIRVSGVSLKVLDAAITQILQCGTNMQRVRVFVRTPPTKSEDISAIFTLRGIVAVIIYNLEQQILAHSRQVVSLLQVTTLFGRCADIIGALVEFIDAVEKAVTDAQVISGVIQWATFFAQKFGWMENLAHEVVVQVTAPWFRFMEGWIGLRPEESALNDLLASGRTFVKEERHEDPGRLKSTPSRVEYNYLGSHMPSFIPKDQALSIFESGRSLRLLKKSHPQHPIARRDVLNRTGQLRLEYATSWADIERIQKRALEYESNLRTEILRYHKEGSTAQPNTIESTQDTDEASSNDIVEKTFELFDIDDEKHVSGSVMDEKTFSNNKVSQMLQKARDPGPDSISFGNRFGPDLASSLYLSFAPIISSQAQLIDFSCLHHLFKEHDVRHHLNLQWRFQLLGDGSFASRLSKSLFDPEMDSGERKAGQARGGVHTGLRLGSRDTWPPASSELRLVLIGILGDCYFSDTEPEQPDKAQNERENELPGGLNFSIRELTDEEIERCKDPNAIEALDFLRLQYKPPETLEALITSRSLKKYDRLFKQLLRLLRMVSVVKGLIRDSTSRESLTGDIRNVFQRFRIDAQHFVLAVSDYCFHVGIGSIWTNFQTTLSRIERCLDRGDIDGTIEAAHSVPRLRDYHEDILDQMLFALLLSKRHAHAAKLLDNIFSVILAFSLLSTAEGLSGLRHENEGAALHLYSTFRKQTSAFVGYLRRLDPGNSSAKSMAKSGAAFSLQSEPMSVFEHLRVRLDMRDYY